MSNHNAAGLPAGAGTLHVSASQIALLIEVAVLAMQDSRQQLAVNETRRVYVATIAAFEAKHGRVGRIDPDNPDHSKIIAATKVQYDAHQKAKRDAYNIRPRLQTACRKASVVNSHSALAVTQ